MLKCKTVTTKKYDITDNDIELRSPSRLILELNIACRNSRAYPKGHPVIAASLSKALNAYEELLRNHEELVLGVTNDSLMVDGIVLEKSNRVYQGFSRALFERGIGALLLHSGLTTEELNNFTVILGLKREQINQYGGIEQIWAKSGITAMSIRPIRYDLFRTVDLDAGTADDENESGEGLWDKFARELTVGELSYGSDVSLDPEIVAKVLNQQYASGAITETEVRRAIADFLESSDNKLSVEDDPGQSLDKLGSFISNLTPELRRDFFESTFGNYSKKLKTASEHILNKLSGAAILETLEDINQNRLTVSPVVSGLLKRLGQDANPPQNIVKTTEYELSSKMKAIFREQASEFTPDDYQKNLDHIISSDRITGLEIERVPDLLSTMESRDIEDSIGKILMNLIKDGGGTPEERDMLLQNFSDRFGFVLQTGDFGQLHKMIDQINDGTFPTELQNLLQDEYGRRDFLEEILDGLTVWGKPRYADIRSLIHKIDGHFVEAILDRLAEEKNMSLRRFYMDSLIEMGPVTKVPILNRLFDKRWYFLRNLLVILSAQNDPSVVSHIRPLLKSDPRLRNEVLKTLVRFGDPLAEKEILADLGSQNPELQAAAIKLAEQCTSPGIVTRLATMLTDVGFSKTDCDRKCSIVNTLGEIGRAEVLPDFAKILSSWSLIYPRQLARLKTAIILSLPKYPPTVSIPVLERIANSSGELAGQAAEALMVIKRNQV